MPGVSSSDSFTKGSSDALTVLPAVPRPGACGLGGPQTSPPCPPPWPSPFSYGGAPPCWGPWPTPSQPGMSDGVALNPRCCLPCSVPVRTLPVTIVTDLVPPGLPLGLGCRADHHAGHSDSCPLAPSTSSRPRSPFERKYPLRSEPILQHRPERKRDPQAWRDGSTGEEGGSPVWGHTTFRGFQATANLSLCAEFLSQREAPPSAGDLPSE